MKRAFKYFCLACLCCISAAAMDKATYADLKEVKDLPVSQEKLKNLIEADETCRLKIVQAADPVDLFQFSDPKNLRLKVIFKVKARGKKDTFPIYQKGNAFLFFISVESKLLKLFIISFFVRIGIFLKSCVVFISFGLATGSRVQNKVCLRQRAK